jgi:DNA-binding XRE family transcriptional regulator
MAEDINKDELMLLMAEKLVLLRASLGMKQGAFASKVGISRQTLYEYEKKKRSLTWNTFLAMLSVFREDKSTGDLLEHFGIYSAELSKYLISPDDGKAE